MSNLTHGYDSYGTKKNTQVQILKNDNCRVLGTKIKQKQVKKLVWNQKKTLYGLSWNNIDKSKPRIVIKSPCCHLLCEHSSKIVVLLK